MVENVDILKVQVNGPLPFDSSFFFFLEFGGLSKHEKTHHALYKWLGLGGATLLQLAFLGEGDPNFPWDTFPTGTTQ